MHVTVDTTEGFNRRMRVEIPEDHIASVVDERLKTLIPTTVIPGFRPGKVPLKLIVHRYGTRVRNDVVRELVPETFQIAATQEKVIPANEPEFVEISADPGKGLHYTAVFEAYPDLELPAMETLKIQRPMAEVTEEDVDRMIETLRKQSRTWSVVDRPAVQGDRILIDFEGVVDPKPVEASTAEATSDSATAPGTDQEGAIPGETTAPETVKKVGVPVELGAGVMIEGFEEGLIGAKADDERTLALEYPSKYHRPELSGRPVTFTVRIRSVEEPAFPESDEEFARRFGLENGNMDTIRSAAYQDLNRKLKFALRMETNQRVIGALLGSMKTIELPPSAIEKEAIAISERKRKELKSIGIDPSNLDTNTDAAKPEARQQLTLSLLLRKLMVLSNATANTDQIRERIEDIASEYQEPKRMIAWYYEDEKRLSTIESAVLQDRIVEWVLEHASVTEEPMSFNELLNRRPTTPVPQANHQVFPTE
uniref:Trigger factor n=1 Tax=Candidatus Kentrum sp. FM TaxID=2126340 RepID=A0A450TT00_9GAMM|nr:MAG: trigger factor [Candidatus Kentron sp. FM]VFJ71777.1 MAG: trigger factor [Candidatus Kentron sp. FM]VFK09009.1 MAG: trigger factor [Candidatus Kentron sp. FM]